MKSKKKGFLIRFGLTVGIVSGAVAAYFLAPKKGTVTQKLLVKNANKLAQQSINKLQEGLIQFEVALADTNREDFHSTK